MNTCLTCAHYESHVDRFDPDGFGWCHMADATDGAPDHASTPFFAQDSDGYSAWLSVRPTHGCNEWTAVDATTPATRPTIAQEPRTGPVGPLVAAEPQNAQEATR